MKKTILKNKENQQKNYIFGFNSVLVALKSRRSHLDKLYLTSQTHTQLARLVTFDNFEVKTLAQIDEIARKLHIQKEGKINHQGVLGIFNTRKIARNITQYNRILILDGITDIGNIASLCRTAALMDFELIIYKDRNMPDIFGDNTIYSAISRLSSGGSELLDFYQTRSLMHDINTLKNADCKIIGLDGFSKDTTIPTKIKQSTKIALVLGSEKSGMERQIKAACDVLFKIDMSNHAINQGLDSLNVSIAGAIGMYLLTK